MLTCRCRWKTQSAQVVEHKHTQSEEPTPCSSPPFNFYHGPPGASWFCNKYDTKRKHTGQTRGRPEFKEMKESRLAGKV